MGGSLGRSSEGLSGIRGPAKAAGSGPDFVLISGLISVSFSLGMVCHWHDSWPS